MKPRRDEEAAASGGNMNAEKAPRKKGTNGRTKGADFERDIAKDLRTWLGDAWTVLRTQTDRQRGQTGHAGEFTIQRAADLAVFPFAIECKAHKAFDEGQLWRVPVVGPLPKFWAQAVRQAKMVSSKPLLIVKRNLGPVLVVVRPGDAATLLGENHWPKPSMQVVIEGEDLKVYSWDVVMASVPPGWV